MTLLQNRDLRQRKRICKAELLKHVTHSKGKTGIAGTATWFSHQVLLSRLAAHGRYNWSAVLRATPHHSGRVAGRWSVGVWMPLRKLHYARLDHLQPAEQSRDLFPGPQHY
jgi:hypothetical protein